MKTFFEHVEHIKGKPHHVRKRVAFAAATGVTAVIALVWLVGSVTSGMFAIQGSNFAESTGQQPVATTTEAGAGGTSGLAGAAAALPAASAPAHIEIVDATSSVPAKPVQQNVIPF
ncbi:MAG TPA: hypothetical protein PLW99_00145 [Candidatus Paceibacterota bacterium]|nr:MAG: hypothetical protein B7X03_02710 [Parcubacteria group bacterium 21-58-10]HQT82556.1 hypothetical protein [Candidatus Paceibacterota bacterium]